ncbi:DUF2922 family protein [Enterococcus sp. AZ109]|uniref:DUF2922 domain-containing protein n=1 Tax=Enterococcus sp. AZ109 TaxID=2774634 RepID=UPI003F1EC7B0
MLKLVTVFEDAQGKKHHWSFNDPNPNKSPEEIQAALETITTLNLFQKNGVRQFQKVVSAKFVETIETPIFDLRKEAEAPVTDQTNAFAPSIVASEDQLAEKSTPVEANEGLNSTETIDNAGFSKVNSPLEETSDLKESNSLATTTEKVASNTYTRIASESARQLETDTNDTDKEQPSASDNFVADSRKERLDRLRAYHEANKKKQKRKKKKKR